MQENGRPEAGTVVGNATRNRNLAIYFVVLLLAGVGLIVGSATLDWGFWGYFGGGLLVFTGAASLFSQGKWGGAGKASCPKCGAVFDVLHGRIHRVTVCPRCATWLQGAETMAPVPDGYVAPHPAFEAPLPERFVLPDGCPVCGRPPTTKVVVEGVNALGFMAAQLAPVGVYRVSKLEVPCCDDHKDGVGLSRWPDGTVIAFRSFDTWKRFCAANGIAPETVGASYWARSEGRRQASQALNRPR